MWSFFKLMVWGIIWLITWPCVTLYRHIRKRPRVDNCFTWAIRQWQNNDGYLVIRWCRSSKTNVKWPHFLWLDIDDHENLRHFLPLRENQEHKYFPDAFFEGRVRTGDPKENIEN